MKKLLQELFSLSCLIAGLYSGYLLVQHISSIISPDELFFLSITIFCMTIWFGRRNKYGLFSFLKDIHQSNLDDIERQELEGPIEQTIVKEQIKSSLEIVALFWLILFLLICGILFVFMPELGLVNWLKLLSVIPTILILRFLKVKLISTIKDMGKNNLDDIEEQQLDEQEA